jgi:hypothetical protein
VLRELSLELRRPGLPRGSEGIKFCGETVCRAEAGVQKDAVGIEGDAHL